MLSIGTCLAFKRRIVCPNGSSQQRVIACWLVALGLSNCFTAVRMPRSPHTKPQPLTPCGSNLSKVASETRSTFSSGKWPARSLLYTWSNSPRISNTQGTRVYSRAMSYSSHFPQHAKSLWRSRVWRLDHRRVVQSVALSYFGTIWAHKRLGDWRRIVSAVIYKAGKRNVIRTEIRSLRNQRSRSDRGTVPFSPVLLNGALQPVRVVPESNGKNC